jgi:putative endonuclease
MAHAQRRGRAGEDAAARFLEGRGWRILDRNWRFHHKEIDLVVERDGVVAFVEVKARRADGWGHPLEAITAAKRRDLATAARGWIASRGRGYETFRFDAVFVVSERGATTLEHVEDAWRLS